MKKHEVRHVARLKTVKKTWSPSCCQIENCEKMKFAKAGIRALSPLVCYWFTIRNSKWNIYVLLISEHSILPVCYLWQQEHMWNSLSALYLLLAIKNGIQHVNFFTKCLFFLKFWNLCWALQLWFGLPAALLLLAPFRMGADMQQGICQPASGNVRSMPCKHTLRKHILQVVHVYCFLNC